LAQCQPLSSRSPMLSLAALPNEVSLSWLTIVGFVIPYGVLFATEVAPFWTSDASFADPYTVHDFSVSCRSPLSCDNGSFSLGALPVCSLLLPLSALPTWRSAFRLP